MNKFIYLLFFSVFFLDYFALKLDLIDDKVALLPDILSMVAVLVVAMLAVTGANAIVKKYVTLFFVFLAVIAMGIAINGLSSGTLIIGIRNYLKFLPFFLVPAVYAFSDKEISRQLKFILALVLIQGPLALFQKFVQFGIRSSGDFISGTLSSGGQVPILMGGVIAVLTAFYLRGSIKTYLYIFCLGIILIPVVLSESKASIGYLPLAFFVPIYFNKRREKKSGNSFAVLAIFSLVAVLFVGVYDYFAQYGRESARGGLVQFFTSGTAETYLNRGAVSARRVTKTGYVDVILLPLTQLSEEPMKLFFGLGIGSVSDSAIEGLKEGKDNYKKYDIAIGSSASLFLWEIGIFGLLIYLLFFYMILQDAKKLSGAQGLRGILGLGWCGVVAIAGLALFFRTMFADGANAYAFWYFSGLIVALSAGLGRERVALNPRKGLAAKHRLARESAV